MKYIYSDHLYGSYYASDEELEDTYCETCGDSDTFFGAFDTIKEFWDCMKDHCSINGSGGYTLQALYPFILETFGFPDDAKYESEYDKDCGVCCNSDKWILKRIDKLIKTESRGR